MYNILVEVVVSCFLHSYWGFLFWGETNGVIMVCEEMESPSPSSETAPSPELLKIDTADSSAESSFRELDDAFLQTQTRIWLGEVLQIRLDEQLIISELLADGELLFQVSKVVWKMLLAKHMELRHIKAYKYHPFAKRNSGRYRPYSNVDSFLKICKILGLTGVDLFSPSDVVEGRNTRRVCMCIRSFSKKSRSMNINVPDFDIVTCMVAMPKDLVGCIRRSIELSHSILADSSSHDLQKPARGKSRQGYSVRDYKTYSDHSDVTEIIQPVLQYNGLHTDDLYDYESEINCDTLSLMVESVFASEDSDRLDIQNHQRNDISNDEFELLSSTESLQYHCSDSIEDTHDCKMTWPSASSCGDLNVNLIGMASHLDTRVEQVQESRITDFDYFEHVLLRNNASVVGTPTNDKTPVTDATLHTNNKKDLDMFDEGNSTLNVHQSASSHGSNQTPQTTERCFDICDNMEVLQVAGMSCLAREPLNLGDQFDADNVQDIESFKLHNDKNDQWDNIKEYETQDIMKFKETAYGITSDASKSYLTNKFEEAEHSLYSSDCYFCNTNSSGSAVPHSNNISTTLLKKSLAYEDRESHVDLRCLDNASCNRSEELLSCQSYDMPEFCKWDRKGKCAMTSNRAKDNKSSSCFLEDSSQKETTPCKQNASEVLMSKGMLSCVPNEEDIVIKLDTDDKEVNNGYPALASDAIGVDDCEKCHTLGDGKGVTTRDIGDGGQRIPDMITNDVVSPTNCDEDVSCIGHGITNQNSKLECNDSHQAYQCDKDPVYHEGVVHIKEEIKPEDERVHSLEYLYETEERGVEIPKSKPQKKLLLRSVLGGATAVGLLFMFLHLRRNGGEKAAEPSKACGDKGKEKIQKNSPRKVKRISTTKGVYAAEKLKLK